MRPVVQPTASHHIGGGYVEDSAGAAIDCRYPATGEIVGKVHAATPAAGVYIRDLPRAHRVVAALEAGTCWNNAYNLTPLGLPFGGVKMSGIGGENAAVAVEHYTQVKSVYVGGGKTDAPF